MREKRILKASAMEMMASKDTRPKRGVRGVGERSEGRDGDYQRDAGVYA